MTDPLDNICLKQLPDNCRLCAALRAVLNGNQKKKVFRNQFAQKSPRALHVLNHGWWRLAVGGWRRLAVGGRQLAVGGGWWWLAVVGGWWLVVGGGWQLAVGRRWRLAAVGGWRLVAVGGWRLVVPWGGPKGRSLPKKKIWSLKDRPGGAGQAEALGTHQ